MRALASLRPEIRSEGAPEGEGRVLAAIEPGQEPRLLKGVGKTAVIEPDALARVGFLEACYQIEQCALAAARWAEENGYRLGRQAERYAVDDRQSVIGGS